MLFIYLLCNDNKELKYNKGNFILISVKII